MTPQTQTVLLSAWHEASSFVKANWFLVIVGIVLVYCIHVRYNTPLRTIPGPFLASLTRLWKVSTILTTRQELVMMDLHKKHGIFIRLPATPPKSILTWASQGKLVRIGPNEISISYPEALKVIYGAGTKFSKTR